MLEHFFKHSSSSFIVRDSIPAEVSNYASDHLNPISRKWANFQNLTLYFGKYKQNLTENPKLEKYPS